MSYNYFSEKFSSINLEIQYFLAGIINIIDDRLEIHGKNFNEEQIAFLKEVCDIVDKSYKFDDDDNDIHIERSAPINKKATDKVDDSGKATKKLSFFKHYSLLLDSQEINTNNIFCKNLQKIKELNKYSKSEKYPSGCQWVGGDIPTKNLVSYKNGSLSVNKADKDLIADQVRDLVFEGQKISIKTKHFDPLGSISKVNDAGNMSTKELFFKRFHQDPDATIGDTENQQRYVLTNLPLVKDAIEEASFLIKDIVTDVLADRTRKVYVKLTDIPLGFGTYEFEKAYKNKDYLFYPRVYNRIRYAVKEKKPLYIKNKAINYGYEAIDTPLGTNSLIQFYNGFKLMSNTSNYRLTYSPIDFICYMSILNIAADMGLTQKDMKDKLGHFDETETIFHGCFRSISGAINNYFKVLITKNTKKVPKCYQEPILYALIKNHNKAKAKNKAYDDVSDNLVSFFKKNIYVDDMDENDVLEFDSSDEEANKARHNIVLYNEAKYKFISLQWSKFLNNLLLTFKGNVDQIEIEKILSNDDFSDFDIESFNVNQDTFNVGNYGFITKDDIAFSLDFIRNLFFGNYYLIIGTELYDMETALTNFNNFYNEIAKGSVTTAPEFSKGGMTVYVGGKKKFGVFKISIRTAGSTSYRMMLSFDDNGPDKILGKPIQVGATSSMSMQ